MSATPKGRWGVERCPCLARAQDAQRWCAAIAQASARPIGGEQVPAVARCLPLLGDDHDRVMQSCCAHAEAVRDEDPRQRKKHRPARITDRQVPDAVPIWRLEDPPSAKPHLQVNPDGDVVPSVVATAEGAQLELESGIVSPRQLPRRVEGYVPPGTLRQCSAEAQPPHHASDALRQSTPADRA